MSAIPVNSQSVKRPSEERFGISKQPPETCPLINDALACVERAFKAIRRYEHCDDIEELRKMISDVDSELMELRHSRNSGLLEDIRDRVCGIRQWGQEWKDLAKQYAPEVEAEEPTLNPTHQ